MLNNDLSQYVRVMDQIEDWEEAIRQVGKPLIEDDCITTNYVESMIQNIHRNGPYVVVMPGVALPHSRSEDGANATCLSFLKLKQPVMFPQEKKIHLISAKTFHA